MSAIASPGSGIIYMKVGVHARETLEEIIARKTQEIRDEGYAMWGYGGGTCHPQTKVQPFVRDFVQQGHRIYLCMQAMRSKHNAEPVRAEEFSADKINWSKIPKGINVRGSQYALVIKALRQESFRLPLEHTVVAIGDKKGRSGDRYIAGRVDKACLIVNEGEPPVGPGSEGIEISLVAELAEPYAVFLRNPK